MPLKPPLIPRNSLVKANYLPPLSGILKGGDLNPGERHSRATRDDGTVTLCARRATTVLSRNCCADFGRPLTTKVLSHSRDSLGVTAPLQTNIVPLTMMWNPPPPPSGTPSPSNFPDLACHHSGWQDKKSSKVANIYFTGKVRWGHPII